MKLSQGEKLILLMLCEIQEHLKIEGGTNTKLIQEAILSAGGTPESLKLISWNDAQKV